MWIDTHLISAKTSKASYEAMLINSFSCDHAWMLDTILNYGMLWLEYTDAPLLYMTRSLCKVQVLDTNMHYTITVLIY